MKQISIKPFLIVVVLGALTAATQAQVIFTENFDAPLGAGVGTSGYAFGDSVSQARGVTPGMGVAGSGALVLTNNTAPNGNGFAGAAVQLQEMTVSGNSSANLNDYVLSFDVTGTAGSLQLQIQTWSGQFFGGTQSGTLNTAPNPPGFGNDLALTSSFTHYSLNLGNLAVFASQGTFSPLGQTVQIAFQLNGGGNGNPSQLVLSLDNVTLTMIPEPSSLALAGLGGMALMIIRRRK